MAFQLFGFGFNGFGQLSQPPETGGTGGTCQDDVALAVKEDIRVYSPRRLMTFSSESHVHLSCAWDALHIFAECSGSCHSISTGRWSVLPQRVDRQVGETENQNGSDSRDVVAQVVEAKDTILLQTSSKLLVGKTNLSHQLQKSTLPPSLCFLSLSGSKLLAITLDCGKVHECILPTPTTELSLSPCVTNLALQITQVCCGSDHVLMLSHSGVVYSFGLGSRGQLGLGDILPRKEACLIEALGGVRMKSVACGNWHSMSLSEYGDIYSWGWNEHGQLGHSLGITSDLTKTVPLPTLVDIEVTGDPTESNCTSIACGSRHSAAVADTGVLYTWGWNAYGQLGRKPSDDFTAPAPVNLGGRVSATAVFCGHWNTIVLCKN